MVAVGVRGGLQLGRSVRAAATGVQRAGHIVSPRAQFVFNLVNITRMHGSAPRCVRSHSRSIWNVANLTLL